MGGRLFARADMWVMVREGPPPRVEAPPEVSCAPGDLTLLLRLGDVPEAMRRKRLDRGDRAVVALWEGLPVSVQWISAGPQLVWELRAEVVPAPGQAFVYGVYTAPAYRRRGLSAVVEQRAAETLASEGITGAVRVVVAGNEAGLKSAKRSGYHRRLRVRYFRFLGIAVHVVQPVGGRTRLRFSLAGLTRPLRLPLEPSPQGANAPLPGK